MSDLHDMSLKEIVRLTREEARREALEEAAQIADRAHRDTALFVTYSEHRAHNKAVDEVADAIRALIDKETRHD